MHLSLESGVVCGRARGRPAVRRQAAKHANVGAAHAMGDGRGREKPYSFFYCAQTSARLTSVRGRMHCCRGLLHSVCQRRVLADTIS